MGEDEYLLDKMIVETTDASVSPSDLRKKIKQQPNLKILGMFRFHLGLYNLSGKNESKGINKWLRKIGEAPIIYNELQMQSSVEQLQLYMQKKGYYNAVVKDSVVLKNQKAKVYYEITSNQAYRYRHSYRRIKNLPRDFLSTAQKNKEMPDSVSVRNYVYEDKKNTLIKEGNKVDSDVLGEERLRILKMLKDEGYFNFSREYIHFMLDSTGKNHQMDVFVGLNTPTDKDVERKYRIEKLSIFTDYDPKSILMKDSVYLSELDTLMFKEAEFIYRKKLNIKPEVILSSILIEKGNLYKISDVERSYNSLQRLNQFQFLNIRFEKKDTPATAEYGSLHCIIQLSPHSMQSYSFELEGSNSSGNIGFAGNFNYQHRNLFKGAEILDVQISAARENLRSGDQKSFNSLEYGAELKLSTPKFLLPFLNIEKFRKLYRPKTVLSLSYNFQQRPDYVRTIADASYGYSWRSKKHMRHRFNLIELNFVDVKDLSDDFLTEIDNLYIQNSFTDHVITTTTYSATYNNQNINRLTNYNYVRFNAEFAGNSLKTIDKLLGKTPNDEYDSEGKLVGSYHDLLGIRYAQYVKGDIEYRFNHYINRANSMVYRLFVGVACPYGNLKVLPFEKSYFSGGANGIRAWQVRSLGPGAYYNSEMTYPNNTADLKLEANVEYRFKLFGALEGALFVDVGNIWAISSKDNRQGADFQLNRFYKELAIGTGLGTRFDLKFILFRLDLGLKLKDPAQATGERWIIANRPFKFSQLMLNIGIGYPF